MTVSLQNKSVYNLILKCYDKQIPVPDFLNLYKEFYNEKFRNVVENDESENDVTTMIEVSNSISDDFVRLLNSSKSLIIAEYLIEVLFVNYNSDLIKAFMSRLNTIHDTKIMTHFFSKACSHFSTLNDKLIIDQLNKDLAESIIPNLFSIEVNPNENELLVSLFKFLQATINLATSPIILSAQYRESSHILLKMLSKINRLLYRKISQIMDLKLVFKDPKHGLKDIGQDYINSPSITSPLFISSPLSLMKTPVLPSGQAAAKYKDIKLIRYYKNIWLNNKIIKWEPINSDFLTRYASISNSIFQENAPNPQITDTLLSDLIETSFTCFAQFVSNKQYHQTNANLNLLERQWIIYISKHLPLLILKHSSSSPQVVTNALEKIDNKVIKAIKAYYSEKDDDRKRNDDLFEDYSTTSLDIRHDFIKSLIILGLQPPQLINDYLRDDQVIDPKSLPTTDDLIIKTPQGNQEVISDIPSFIKNSLSSLELQTISGNANETDNEIYKVLLHFESISPTKQEEFSQSVLIILEEAISSSDFSIITKLCALLSFNFSHSLTSILTFCTPTEFTKTLMNFIDIKWSDEIKTRKEDSDDSDEAANISLSFSWALLLLINITQTYDISLINVYLVTGNVDFENSFCIKFISKLSEIPDEFIIDEQNAKDSETQLKSHKLIQAWLSDLFVNGSISDNQMQNTDAKQLANIIPFIFKQVLYALEINAVSDFNNIIGGMEYFLQPFMLSGFFKLIYWLEDYLLQLNHTQKKDDLINMVFTIFNTIFNPNTLNEDAQTFHNAVLRLNAVKLLQVFRRFRKQTQSDYGVYASDSQDEPILNSLISKMISVLNISPCYYVDPHILSPETGYSQQKPVGYDRFSVFNENPINKIMTNQINSFWNLHSSTYYNLDYLKEIIHLVTPKRFLLDIIQTLDYKLITYGVPAARSKMTSIESEHVFDYFFYFLVLFDCESQIDATRMIQLFEDEGSLEESEQISNSKIDITIKDEYKGLDNTIVKAEEVGQPKSEYIQDDDLDMLFGENENSVQMPDEELKIIDIPNAPRKFDEVTTLKRDSFGYVLYEMKRLQDISFKSKNISQEEHEKFCKYYNKYLHMLKICVF